MAAPLAPSIILKRLCLDQITICSLDDELESVIKCDFKPQTQNIFSYLADLKKAMNRLQDLNSRLPENGRIVLPDSFVRSRLIRAARQVPVYKPVIDALVISGQRSPRSIPSTGSCAPMILRLPAKH